MVNKMLRKPLLVVLVLIIASGCKCAISDKRLCADPACLEPVSHAKTLIRYTSDDVRILSFQKNVEAIVFSKSSGSRPDLWGVEINGKRGYAPKEFLREYKIIKSALEHTVTTDEIIPDSDSTTVPSVVLSEGSDTLQVANVIEDGKVKEDVPSSETLKPFEVVDGTTIYLNTEVPLEPVEIKASSTKLNIETALPSAGEPESATVDEDKSEGSTGEKLYNYLVSNFITEESSGESTTTTPTTQITKEDVEQGSLPKEDGESDEDDDEYDEEDGDDEEEEDDDEAADSKEDVADHEQHNPLTSDQPKQVGDNVEPSSVLLDTKDTVQNISNTDAPSTTLEIQLSDTPVNDVTKSVESEVASSSETVTVTESVQPDDQPGVLHSENVNVSYIEESKNESYGTGVEVEDNVVTVLPDEDSKVLIESVVDPNEVHRQTHTDSDILSVEPLVDQDSVEMVYSNESTVTESSVPAVDDKTSDGVTDDSDDIESNGSKETEPESVGQTPDFKGDFIDNEMEKESVTATVGDVDNGSNEGVEETDFSEDESALITSTPDDLSVTTSDYTAEIHQEDGLEHNTVISEEGFMSSLFSYFSSNRVEESGKSVDSEASDNDDSARNAAWSYTKQDEHCTPETSSSCLAEAGIGPDSDKVVVIGNIPDNEALLQQIIPPEQSASGGSRMGSGSWDYGGSYGSLSYLGIITAISAIIVILGHWFIEKMRCDSTFIKRINELERALLYAELESKNLKLDLEETQQRVVGVDDSVLQEQLKTTQELEEKCSTLEEKNASLQSSLDAATEAGLELNRMLSELLAANKGSEALIVSVNDLQDQLNSQQTTINNMKIIVTTKEAESESLRNNVSSLQGMMSNLEQELNHMTETLNEVLVEKANQERLKDGLEMKVRAMKVNEKELLNDISKLRNCVLQMESASSTQDMEIVLLQQYIKNLKGDIDCEETQPVKDIFNIAKVNTLCEQLSKEKNKLMDELAGEKDAHQLLEAHVKVITNEVDTLRKAFEQSEKEKNEAITKHAVLADYFKDKESQLHKELGYRDALYMKTKGDATSVHEEVKSLQEELENYKSQVTTLKQEIADQERGMKSQLLAFEKKSHENWLAARQAERKLQEAKLEAGQLRNRLTMIEKNSSNVQNDRANDREPLDPSVGTSVSPQLFPVDPNPFVPRAPPVAPPEEPPYRASPRPQLAFTVDESRDPSSQFYGLLNPNAPFDPYWGRPIQDRYNPDLYHLVPYFLGTFPPPPVLPNDRRPPPLGRMSSPPVERPSPTAHRSRRRLAPSPRRRRTPSPEHRRSPSDSSPDSGPESSRYARRYDSSPESSYRCRSRTPSPTSFRPISNNQGSNRSSNQSEDSGGSNRRGGRL